MAIEGGRIKLYYTADLSTTLPDLDDATTTLDWTSASWTELEPLEESLSVSFVEEAEDVIPLSELWRREDLVIMHGIDTVTGVITTRSAADLSVILSTSEKTTVASASSQVGKDELTWENSYSTTYRRVALEMKDNNGMWFILVLNKVRFLPNGEVSFGHNKSQIPFMLKCFAMTSAEAATATDVTDDARCWEIHDMTAAAA